MKKRTLILYTALSLLILSLVVSFAACHETEKNGTDTDAITESQSVAAIASDEPTESEKTPDVTTEPEIADTEEPTETAPAEWVPL